ncbi:DUF6759 domain-containing protein [Soonwooa sp.]|uniref:DUF6759 domain-containing protein n=1 Tax=Soonwooa sp. TaxID=1938592 RepID=UPI00261E5339|nr:DUF6759 domain-containing protein [Soonwooa sp.]
MFKIKAYFLIAFLLLLVGCDIMPTSYPTYRPNSGTSSSVNESREFAELIAKDQINKKDETAQVLTYLLNNSDPKDKQTAAVITNTSSCDIIVRLIQSGTNKVYNLPVSKNTKNQFVIDKGNYTLKSNVCGAQYYSQKNISDALVISLGTK